MLELLKCYMIRVGVYHVSHLGLQQRVFQKRILRPFSINDGRCDFNLPIKPRDKNLVIVVKLGHLPLLLRGKSVQPVQNRNMHVESSRLLEHTLCSCSL